MLMPTIHENYKPLQDLLLKKSEANILLAAVQLNLFSELTDYHSAEELAEKLTLHPRNTEVILNALVSFDLICKCEELYWNTPLANEFLVRGKPTYLGDYLWACNPWYTLPPEKICDLVRVGPSASDLEFGIQSEEFWEMQARGSINYQRSGMAQLLVSTISSLPEYPRFKRMLDLGCGPGLFGIALVLDHPSLEAVLFDRPTIITHTQNCVKEYAVSDRVTVVPGDYLQDSIGSGYDLILASMTLNFALGNFAAVITKIYEALNPGGVFVAISDGRTEEGTKPEDMVIPMLFPELTGNIAGIHEGFIADAMLNAGFSSVRRERLLTPIGEVDCEVGRKKADI